MGSVDGLSWFAMSVEQGYKYRGKGVVSCVAKRSQSKRSTQWG